MKIIPLQDYLEGVDPDKLQRYDTLYRALMKHDPDFAFMDAVMGREWVQANYSTKQLTTLWEDVVTTTYHIPLDYTP